MELLENKSIFVMGATGFLGKIMVEKILRVQPNVKKLYLLIRSTNEITAIQRFNNEVVEKDLFRVLKEKWGGDINNLISKKICLVMGNITSPNLGLKDSNLLKEMKNQIEIIVNLAATTKFDERYDVAFGTNTLGAKHVLDFAKQCSSLEVLVHVSTGEREGVIQEIPYKMGESLNGTIGLNIETEQKLVEETLNKLRNKGATQETITLTMKNLGLKRAEMYGWPNTYVFTKAMGEMIISDIKNNLPLVIIRPTIVTSTYKQPFPGWIEGMRTIDSLIVGYGKGKITFFPFDINSLVDLIPADMVVNAMIMTMSIHARKEKPCHMIYHVGSSRRNGLKYEDLEYFIQQYFIEKPLINREGEAIKVRKAKIFDNMLNFHRYMTIRYSLFFKGFEVVNTMSCYWFKETYDKCKKKFNLVMRLVELYRPYLFFKATFDDTNTGRLRSTTRNSNLEDTFYFDPVVINWNDYLSNIHIPGLFKYAIK